MPKKKAKSQSSSKVTDNITHLQNLVNFLLFFNHLFLSRLYGKIRDILQEKARGKEIQRIMHLRLKDNARYFASVKKDE